MQNHTLTFWRDDNFMGTLVTRIPRGKLYPVVCLFNTGSSVVICDLNEDPFSILSEQKLAQKNIKEKKLFEKRQMRKKQAELLVKDDALTPDLISVLHKIFLCYADRNFSQSASDSEKALITLDHASASRLWYRCRFELSSLDTLNSSHISVNDFVDFVHKHVTEEKESSSTSDDQMQLEEDHKSSSFSKFFSFEAGDTVELSDDFEKYGDAGSGPLQPGDRGSVTEVQKCSDGETQSVRVVFNSRRWWYQPGALWSERSGLLESATMRRLKMALRPHGYTQDLNYFGGKVVDDKNWEVEDLVISALPNHSKKMTSALHDGKISLTNNGSKRKVNLTEIGRMSKGSIKLSHVMVEYLIGTKRVRTNTAISSLVHFPFSQEFVFDKGCTDLSASIEGTDSKEESCSSSASNNKKPQNERIEERIKAVGKLDCFAIKDVTNDCISSLSMLAAMFSHGLPTSVVQGFRQLYTEPHEASLRKLSRLVIVIIKKIFTDSSNLSLSLDECETSKKKSVSHSKEHHLPDGINVADLMINDLHEVGSDFSNEAEQRDIFLSLLANTRATELDAGGLEYRSRSRRLGLLSSFRSSRSSSSEESLNEFVVSRPVSRSLPNNVFSGHQDYSTIRNVRGDLNRLRRDPDAASSWREVRSTLQHASTRRATEATKNLIQIGLLLNVVPWAHKSVADNVDINFNDEEGNSLLWLAISFECDLEIVTVLVQSGVPVTMKDLSKAAITNQPAVLKFLLKYCSYVDGSINLSTCCPDIANIISEVQIKQQIEKQALLDSAPQFVDNLLSEMIKLALKFRFSSGMDSFCRLLTKALVGDIFVDIMKNVKSVGDISTFCKDILLKISGTDSHEHSDLTENWKSNALMMVIPCSVLQGIQDDTMIQYFRLCEDFLWSKDVSDVAMGLLLALIAVKKFPSKISQNLEKYGFSGVAANHIARADLFISKVPHSSGKQIKCPKNHDTHFFFTSHGSFRCDLCGGEIGQSKPMVGCRICDWDACEECIDKKEGGVLKWALVKELSQTLCSLLPLSGKEGACNVDEEIAILVKGIMNRDKSSLELLNKFLKTPGKITHIEFQRHIIPALFESLVVSDILMDESTEKISPKLPIRKKPRVCFTKLTSKSSISLRIKHLCSTQLNFMKFAAESIFGSKKSPEVEVDCDVPELIRRLHVILSFEENVPVLKNKFSADKSDLENLVLPIKINLESFRDGNCSSLLAQPGISTICSRTVLVEPLLPFAKLQEFVLRTCPIKIPSYLNFCEKLAMDRAIIAIAESEDTGRRIARVIAFHEKSGAHIIRYASHFYPSDDVETDCNTSKHISDQFKFGMEEAWLILASRDYYVLGRDDACDIDVIIKTEDENVHNSIESISDDDIDLESNDGNLLLPVGTRVESNFKSNNETWDTYTVVGSAQRFSGSKKATSELNSCFYDLVDEKGFYFSSIPESQLRGNELILKKRNHQNYHTQVMLSGSDGAFVPDRSQGISEGIFERGIHISSLRRSMSEIRNAEVSKPTGVMRRQWSALQNIQQMRPIDLQEFDQNVYEQRLDGCDLSRRVSIGGKEVQIQVDPNIYENSPTLTVEFCIDNETSPRTIPPDLTVFHSIQILRKTNQSEPGCSNHDCKLFYCIKMDSKLMSSAEHVMQNSSGMLQNSNFSKSALKNISEVNIKPTFDKTVVFNHFRNLRGCDGLNVVCQQCIYVIGVLAATNEFLPSAVCLSETDQIRPMFVSKALTKKLLDQLEDPMSVTSGFLPNWCRLLVSTAPHLFSFDVRKKLLERGGTFGVSRAVYDQQEVKVDVTSLRSRIENIRQRAVALMQEAFSEDATDPMALQLQANELYSLEEVLKRQVTDAFRKQHWSEHFMQSAKGIVRREYLIADSITMMEAYAQCSKAKKNADLKFNFKVNLDSMHHLESSKELREAFMQILLKLL
uniref:Uncharacterized protein n=1 Tax=Corethron hystrix TaxID=216773 RepID=A0A7S1B4W0_9STRA|mmetsp:Transcript_12428/g.27337  ORF Transcript_12428/g.27337 Transcript_12428/m.27337 type:complete len:1923 (+) Transcript_12428:695-6463(+)